jgi:cation:H+ antiporter
MGTQLPKTLIFARVTPGSLLILVLWLVGLWLVSLAHKGLPWQDSGRAPDRSGPPPSQSKQQQSQKKKRSTGATLLIFGIASLVTLVAGVALEESSNAIAAQVGLSNVLFGATVLAAATALPEVSTGLASVKLQQFDLAMSDIFGGNAFLPVLFLLADVLSGQDALAQAQNSDIYLACLGVLLTAVYLCGLIFRPRLQILRMGIDSFVVLVLYLIGIGGLAAIALTAR